MRSCIIFTLILAAAAFAAIVPVDRAQRVAENYYQNYAPTSATGSTVKQVLTKEYLGQPTWYVFEFTKGWIIVAADDAVRPVLGYSFESTVDEDLYNMQNPFVARFSSYDKQIVHNVREGSYVNYEGRRQWKNIENGVFPVHSASKSSAGPLLETTWHQNYPFNDQCPEGTPTGSVATAMHQIMRFHLGPSQGAGSNSYNDSSGDITGTHSVDFSSQSYDWSLMMTLNGSTSTQAERDELSKMAYHLGVSVNMDYNTDGSGAYMTDAETAYKNNWTADGATYVNTGTITDPASQYATIMSNIDNNRPIQWAGSSAESGGHSFVLDGYNIETENGIYLYHFNWGWSGSYDGWFYLNDLTPGASDFSEGQQYIHNIELGWGPSFYCYASITDASVVNDSVSLQWEWVCNYENLILSHYEMYRDSEIIAELPDSVTSFVDHDLMPGEYFYRIVSYFGTETDPAAYSWSHWSYSNYTAEIIDNPSYPRPIDIKAESYHLNRQKIDLSWTKPFVGTTYFSDDFENSSNSHGVIPSGWWQKGAESVSPSLWYDIDTVNYMGWISVSSQNYPEWVFDGSYSCGSNGDGEEFPYQFIISENEFILPGDVGVVDYYTFYYDGTEQGVFLFQGDIGASPDGNIITLKNYTTGNESWEHDEIDLSPYSGTYRFGFYKKTQSGGSLLCFDNVILGWDEYPDPVGSQPVSYDIYRNGEFAVNVPATGFEEAYEDNGFADGWNEYYIKAVYTSGTSLSSKRASAWIDANPVPMFLTGVWDDVNAEVDLDWYAPGHYPPHWFGYQWESDSWNYLTHHDPGTGEITLARTYYKASDFGMSYPVYISDLSAAFLEDVDAWSSNQFTIAIGTGTEGAETYLHTSGNLTAIEDGTWVDYALPATETINEDWFVEVAFGSPSDCTPNVLTYIHEEGVDPDQWNSVFYWTGNGTTSDPGWYAYSYDPPYEFEDWAFLCYGWNDEPVITKNGQPAREPVAFTPIEKNRDITKNEVKSFGSFGPKEHEGARVLRTTSDRKALESYNIYRNGTLYDTATGTSYRDTSPLLSNEYYITAVYSNPPGESEPS
ncbi:MAG: C10 family peptidase, partial [Candidatus Delongbacteria bacterium]